jgi:hypothetical protein
MMNDEQDAFCFSFIIPHSSFSISLVSPHTRARVPATGTVVAHTLLAAVPRMIKMQPVEHSVSRCLTSGRKLVAACRCLLNT